jgi:hypothetical protein
MCFHCRNMNFWYISHVYTKIHMYHILYMKYTVLLVFSCVFTMFSLQNHLLLVHFSCIPKYTCTIYSTWNAQFCSCFHVFSLCFHCRNINFWYISFKFTRIHMYHIFCMKCTVLLVFSLCFPCKNIYFWYISHVYQNTHVPYILHEMHCFASVFMCFYCVFTAETCTFGTFYMFIPNYTCIIYSTWNPQFC